VVDDSLPHGWGSLVRGIVPPPDVTPLDQATRDWLVKAYQLPDHNHTIAPVEHSKQE
jgi:hypothetical protein